MKQGASGKFYGTLKCTGGCSSLWFTGRFVTSSHCTQGPDPRSCEAKLHLLLGLPVFLLLPWGLGLCVYMNASVCTGQRCQIPPERGLQAVVSLLLWVLETVGVEFHPKSQVHFSLKEQPDHADSESEWDCPGSSSMSYLS